jgi:DNA-binding transcriptional ArsR family regulator
MANKKRESEALPLGPQELPELVAHRRITDPASIKALSDPLRIKIIRLMGEGAHEHARSFTVKQIATALGEPPTKLYRHIKQLLNAELIQVAEVRLVGGIVEQHYRVAQAGFAIDPEADEELDKALVELGGAAIEDFLARYVAALESGRTYLHGEDALAHPPHVRGFGTIADCRIPQEKAADFAERLHALVEEFGANEHDETGVRANLLTIFYATE